MTIAKAVMVSGLLFGAGCAQAKCPEWLDQTVHKLRSTETINLCELKNDKPMLIVNTASFCGYTGQFKGLEALYKRFREQGFEVVGVPSNDFRQEADSQAKTAEVCFVDYGVTFTMTAPQTVKGDQAQPLYRGLADASGSAPGWNFTKYLINADGERVQVFSSKVTPDSPELVNAITTAIAEAR